MTSCCVWRKNTPKGTAAKNGHNNSREGQPPTVPDVSKYENWYPDEKHHETAERKYWGGQRRLGLIGVIFTLLTFAVAVAAAMIAGYAYKETKRQAKAAEDQVIITTEMEHEQLLAYVSAKVGHRGIINCAKNQDAEL